MTPLEEQVEKLARRWEKEADEGELLDEVAYALEGAADELRALLPLEVTDESVTVTFDRDIAEALERGITASFFPEENILRSHAHRLIHAALTHKGDNE